MTAEHPVVAVRPDGDGHRVVTVGVGVTVTALAVMPNAAYFAGDVEALAAAVGARMVARAATLRGDRP